MNVGFVCTNYNNSALTRAAIASLYAGAQSHDVRVAVVDNKSHESDVAALRSLPRDFPGVELVLNEVNIGYFPGLNVGLRHLRAKFPDFAHFVVGNNDLEFPVDFLQNLERHSAILEEWAVVAPDLVTFDNVHQNPHVLHPISRLRRLVWDVYFLSYHTAKVIKGAARLTRRFTTRPENAPDSTLYRAAGPIEQGYGACYLIGPKFFRHFTRLWAPTFMMQEEYFLFEQLKSIGQLTWYDPRFVVLHRGHATTNAMPSRRYWEISRDAHRTYKHYRALPASEQQAMIAAGCRAEAA